MNFIKMFSTQTLKNKKYIPKALRSKVWYTYNHNNLCYCCEITPITPFNFECGHVDSKINGGLTTLQNLRPLCTLCNRSMSRKNLYDFKNLLKIKFY